MAANGCAGPGGSGTGAAFAWTSGHRDDSTVGDRPHGVDKPLETPAAKLDRRVVWPLCVCTPHLRRDRAADDPYGAVNRAAQASLPALLARWLPDGSRTGREYVAHNPAPTGTAVRARSGSTCSPTAGRASRSAMIVTARQGHEARACGPA
jgi:hypothetical protein